MAKKYKTVGYVTKSGKWPDGQVKHPQVVLTQSIKVPEGDKAKVFLSLYEPRKGETMTEEKFAEVLAWKRYDVVLATEET